MTSRTWLLTRALLVTVGCAALLVPLATTQRAAASPAGDLVAMTNAARSERGLSRYAVASDLSAVAARQASYMARNRRLSHTSDLGGKVCCWESVGENVGEGPDARTIHRAFMASSSHRANILSTRFREIGVGTARASDGTLYVSEVFRRPSGSSGTAEPPADSGSDSATDAATNAAPRTGAEPSGTLRSAPRASRSGLRTALVPAAPRLTLAQLIQRWLSFITRRAEAAPRPVGLDPAARVRYWSATMRRVSGR